MKSIIKIFTINAFILVLSACGGGTGAGDVDEANQNNISASNIGNTNANTNTNVSVAQSTSFDAVKTDVNKCVACHKAIGIASSTRLILEPNNDNANIIAFRNFATNNGIALLLSKSIGRPFHVGGAVFSNSSTDAYKRLETFLASLNITPLTPSTPATPSTPSTPAPPSTPSAPATSSLNRSVLQAKCVSCHSATGVARSTALVFQLGDTASNISFNEAQLTAFMNSRANGAQTLLDKPRGIVGHAGGTLLATGSAQYILLANFVGLLPSAPAAPATPQVPGASNKPFALETTAETYRRASLYLTGKIPSRNKVLSLQGVNEATLRSEITNLMQGDGFKEFLKNGANARLNSRHLLTSDSGARSYNNFYLPNASNSERRSIVRRDLAEEPLEIIANVVMNNRPYSEILTAGYTMVGQYTDESYNTGLDLASGQWQQAQNTGQDVKTSATYNKKATGGSRISNFPHAGVLSTWSYLSKYGTTATNRNRARSRWTMYHFLGFDIEKSTARTVNISDVADQDNPTLNNPACTVCHITLDPIAGAFKFFHESNGYKANGTDSLDRRYRQRNPGVDWYTDMLQAGFNNQTATGDPLQWLAQRLVTDSRFATGAVKFWWFAVFGEDILDPSAPRIQYNTQQLLVTQLADDFRTDLNLKRLLANMMMSDNFRAAVKTNASQADSALSIHMGGRRLLSGTELKNKTASLTGITWGNNNPRLDREYKMLYGGTDDVTVEKRSTSLSSMMFRVAERQANEIGCAAVVYDFSLARNARSLFTQVDATTLDEASIRNQIVVLYERLLNRMVSSDSADVNQAYQLFLDLRQARINAGGGTRVDSVTRCDNRIGGSRNDASFVLSPWRGLVIALMSDPDYLYE